MVNKISKFYIKAESVTVLCQAILESETKRKINNIDPVFMDDY